MCWGVDRGVNPVGLNKDESDGKSSIIGRVPGVQRHVRSDPHLERVHRWPVETNMFFKRSVIIQDIFKIEGEVQLLK